MSATLESRTLIVSPRRLRVLKAALAGMEIEATKPAEWMTTGAQAAGLLITPRQEKNGAYVMKTRYSLPLASMYARKSALICVW